MIDQKIKAAWTLLNGPTASDDPMIAAAFVIASAYVEAEARARMAEFAYSHRWDCHRRTLADWIKEVEAELSK